MFTEAGLCWSLHCDAVRRGGAEREQWRPLHSPLDFITPSTTHNQIGPLWCWFLSGWACAHSRPLWVSPMTSPVRLGVSPTAAPTPMGVFNQRFEALFCHTGALGPAVCPGLFVRKCGAAGCYPPHCLPRSPPLCVRPSRFICVRMWGRRVC